MKFANKLLSEVAFFQEGPGVRKFQFRNEGVKLLNVGNINKGVLDTSTTKLYISEEEAYGKYKHFLVDEGDLLIASSGIVVENFHNKIAYVKKEHLPLCLNTSTIRFKTLDQSVFNLDYLKFYLKTTHFKNQLKKLITGAAQLNFGPSHLKKITLPVPALSDQLHIANLLSKAENLIAQRKESIRLLDEFLKSTFLEMFGDAVKNEKNWKKSELKNYAKVRIGPFGSLLHREDYVLNGVPLVNPSHISEGKIVVDSELTISPKKMTELSAYVMHEGDVVLGRRGEIGRCAVVTRKEDGYLCGTGSIFIRPTEKLNPIFLYNIISSASMRKVLENSAKGITMKNLNSGIIENLKIPVPPIEIQTQFAQIVAKIETLNGQYQQSLQELENLYGSLSQRAFRGELSVKQNNSVTA